MDREEEVDFGECGICYEEFDPGADIVQCENIRVAHHFHRHCSDRWVMGQGRNYGCPHCHSALPQALPQPVVPRIRPPRNPRAPEVDVADALDAINRGVDLSDDMLIQLSRALATGQLNITHVPRRIRRAIGTFLRNNRRRGRPNAIPR